MHTFRVKKAKTLQDNLIGLLGSSKPYPLLLKTHFGIHTFFMKYSIDVLILDNNNYVKYLKEDLKPWRVYFWNPIYDLVLELPAGSISKEGIIKGDILKLISS